MAEATCSIEGCERPHYGRGWCKMHYQRWLDHGTPGEAAPLLRARGHATNVRGPWEGCWKWQGSRFNKGHGRYNAGAKTLRVHRLVYEAIYGPIPDGLCVCHRCDNPPCFRPDHLFLGTTADNNADMVSKGRQARGERRPEAQLTEAQVREIRRRHANGETSLGLAFKVTPQVIYSVVNRRSWNHVA